ncbi:MAG TPA: hypothetical protein ENH87_20650 [Pricia antarctica]|uniref:Uncharacterized protein n=1 Tax=Pricia antarctica TaxID=641691 RepID=A0A831QVF5_9FLAO|nr:hypothetical protein [Pricia antarctica]
MVDRNIWKETDGKCFFVIMGMAILLAFSEPLWEQTLFMDGFIIMYRLFNTFAKIGVFAIVMQCCSRNVSASQFNIYMTKGSIAGASLIGPIKENFSWEISFLIFVGFMLLAWLVMEFLNIDQQIKK